VNMKTKNQIKLGGATYLIERHFAGTREVQDIILERMLRERGNHNTAGSQPEIPCVCSKDFPASLK